MQYRRIPTMVDAVKMASGFLIGDVTGKKGDWLLTEADGSQRIMTDEQFSREFEQAEPIAPPAGVRLPPRELREDFDSAGSSHPVVFDENQASVVCCATCGKDVKRSAVDLLFNCADCRKGYKIVMPEQRDESGVEKSPVIVLCDNCGAPGPKSKMGPKGCFRCDPELMAKEMSEGL